MKKIYESPSVEKNILMAEESLMNEPTPSVGSFGIDDIGPVK